MSNTPKGLTPSQVIQAVESVREARPSYAEMLGFYGKLFEAQVVFEETVRPEPVDISPEIHRIKKQEQMPLVNKADFAIDAAASRDLFLKICDMSDGAESGLPVSFATLKEAAERDGQFVDRLFEEILKEGVSFASVSEELGVDEKLVSFIAYNSIKPSVISSRRQMTEELDLIGKWTRGCCPVCGQLPVLSTLVGDGDRTMICGFCWHEWAVTRIFCPFCESTDGGSHQYFYSEEEKEYRVDLCDGCNTYLKTVDLRQFRRIFFPPLEHLITLHLDMQAQDGGYAAGVPLDI